MKRIFVLGLLLLLVPLATAESLDVSRSFSKATVLPGGKVNMTVTPGTENFDFWAIQMPLPSGWKTDKVHKSLFYYTTEEKSAWFELEAPNKKGIYTFEGQWSIVQHDASPQAGLFAPATVVVDSSCDPQTCNALKKRCGVWDDGCGAKLDCGNCSKGKTCNLGICEVPKPINYQKRFERATFSLFSIVRNNIPVNMMTMFRMVRDRLSGTFYFRTSDVINCNLNRFRLTSGNISSAIGVNGTAMLTCTLPVKLYITNESITGSYNGTKVFDITNLQAKK
jgi:hypothetical protein